MGYILTTGTEPDILETIRFVAVVRGSHEVIVAQTALEVLQRARRDRPSLAIWDLGFNDRRDNRHLSQWYADSALQPVPVVLLAPAGASAGHGLPSPLPDGTICLVKPVDLIELGLRLGALLDPGTGRLSPPADYRRQLGELTLDYQLFEVRAGDKTVSLTPTEFKLLRYLMENAGQTFSSEQLLDEVWKYPPGVGSLDVVRMYVKRLRDKIEPDPREPQYIVTVPGHGYRMPIPVSDFGFRISDFEFASRRRYIPMGIEKPAKSQIRNPKSQIRNGDASAVYFGALAPSTAIDGTLQEILVALQTVTLTCQATLATMAHLMDQLSSNSDSLFSHLLNQPDPATDDIAIAVHSLNGLVAELQSTLTQLQSGRTCTMSDAILPQKCKTEPGSRGEGQSRDTSD